MTSDMQLLHNVTSYPSTDTVQVGNGENLSTSHIGDSNLGLLAMPNVLFIPKLAANLLSLFQLCKQNNCRMIFDELHCIIQDKTKGRILYKGPCSHGVPEAVSHRAMLGNKVDHTLWHKRLGHPSNVVVKHMLIKSQITSVIKDTQSMCESCLTGKFARLPFENSDSRCNKPFQLVHSDV
ncbi:hypothetical protein Dimus_039128 [Dionaea muscipula]